MAVTTRRDRTSQKNRMLKALQTDYVSVEERTVEELYDLARDYAKGIDFFDLTNARQGDWFHFFDEDLEDAKKKPHFALFWAFLHLLQYPQEQFNAFTQRHLDFYYKQALQLEKKEAIPDRVHVLFEMASGVNGHLLPKDTLLDAGTDEASGESLYYKLDEDLEVNQAKITEVHTLLIQKSYQDLWAIQQEAQNEKDGFEQVLCWVLGEPNPGDYLPIFTYTYPSASPQDIPVDLDFLILYYEALVYPNDDTYYSNFLNYLNLDLEGRINSRTLESSLFDQLEIYLLEQLYFVEVNDFKLCLEVFTTQQNVTYSESSDWEEAYQTLERAYQKRVDNACLQTLTTIHKNPEQEDPDFSFDEMMGYAFGSPDPGHPLPVMPVPDRDLDELAKHSDEPACTDYIRKHLHMLVSDFQKIMEIKNKESSTSEEWQTVYETVEIARREMRGFEYPAIGKTQTEAICPTTIIKEASETIPAFSPFGMPSGASEKSDAAESQQPGLAVSSSLLELQEGERQITLTIACQEASYDQDGITEMLKKDPVPFEAFLVSDSGSIAPDTFSFQAGNFIFDQPVKSIEEGKLVPLCFQEESTFEADDQWVLFSDGLLYQIIEQIDPQKVKLKYHGWFQKSQFSKTYKNLTLQGSFSELSAITLTPDSIFPDLFELATEENHFSDTDLGKWVITDTGGLYCIETFYDFRTVQARLQGSIPSLGTAPPRKYNQFVLESPNNHASLEVNGLWTDHDFFDYADVDKIVFQDHGILAKITKWEGGQEVETVALGQTTKTQALGIYNASSLLRHSLQFQLGFESEAPAFVPSESDSTKPWSRVEIRMKPIYPSGEDNNPRIPYDELKLLQLEQARIDVQVSGVTDLKVRNDSFKLNTKSPFTPFGETPEAKDGFYFAGNEICQYPLTQLVIQFDWKGLPDDFTTYYQAYTDSGLGQESVDNSSYQVALKYQHYQNWTTFGDSQALFPENLADEQSLITFNADKAMSYFEASPDDTGANDPMDWPRHFKLEFLGPDFQHDIYPQVLEIDDTANEPFVPTATAVSLTYQATTEFDFTQNTPQSSLFQLHPFGEVTISENCPHLFPQYQAEGHLYLGVENLQPPQNLTILFQMAASVGDEEIQKSDIQWNYLAGDVWKAFQAVEILKDSTNQLLDAGILKLTIPDGATNQHDRFSANKHWIQASIEQGETAFPDVLDLRTQAVSAVFQDEGLTPEHLTTPLSANCIQGLVTREPNIKKVDQPYSSMDGRAEESDETFYVRVSERLRHKNRAWASWDYERFVLEQFPEIYKAKCLNAEEQDSLSSDSNSRGSGKVVVVVIPDISNTAPFFPLKPKVPSFVLTDIKESLSAVTSPFVELEVKNPQYEEIIYRFSVRFRDGYDQGHYLKELNEQVKQFLSPWAYGADQDIPFESVIRNALVIQCMEELPYVDYIANFKLFSQVILNDDSTGNQETEYVVSSENYASVSRPDAILVSGEEHIIDPITTEYYEPSQYEGIGYLIIGIDFVLGP